MYREPGDPIFDGVSNIPKIPTAEPLIDSIGFSSIVSGMVRLYDSLMLEVLSSHLDDQAREASLAEVAKRLKMLLAEAEGFNDSGTEMWLHGSDLGITTSDPDILKELAVESGVSDIEDLPDQARFHIPAKAGIQFFFDSFVVGEVLDPTSDDTEATIPYALSIRAENLQIHFAHPENKKIFLPGLCTITPLQFEKVEMGIVFQS